MRQDLGNETGRARDEERRSAWSLDTAMRGNHVSGFLITLLGGFRISVEAEIRPLRNDAQRLVAFLSLQPSPALREHIAGVVWNDHTQDRANSNLRTALWRTRSVVPGLITTPEPQHLAIAPNARIDVSEAKVRARRIVSDGSTCRDDDLNAFTFAAELLPGWYDEWVVVEREHLSQLRLHAIEAISAELQARGHLVEAMEAALTAVDLDPLRESAHRCVIRVHLAEGNRSEALLHFEQYQDLLHRELGIGPSEQLKALLRDGAALRGDSDLTETPRRRSRAALAVRRLAEGQ